MRNKKLVYLLSITALAVIAFSCADPTLPPGIDNILNVTIDGSSVTSSSVYDFGTAAAEGAARSVTVSFLNASGSDLTVSDVDLTDWINFSVSGPQIPFTAVDGSETEITLIFQPGSSDVFNAVLTVTIAEAPEDYTLNLQGTGDYAPAINFGVSVTGAGDTAANGFYTRLGFYTSGSGLDYPAYVKSGTPNYYLYSEFLDGDVWSIDPTQGNTTPAYDNWDYIDSSFPQEANWQDNIAQTPQPPTVTVYDIKGTVMEEGSVITAAYQYSDSEGDAENSSRVKYQWYRSTVRDDGSQFTALSGATSKTYTLQTADVGYYFRVGVTTAASTGYTEDVLYMSSPTVQVTAIPQ